MRLNRGRIIPVAAVLVTLALAGCPTPATYGPTITPIYAATNAGLEIYNGTNWTKVTAGLASSNVTCVVVSGSGADAAIFAGTPAGLSYSRTNGSTWTTWHAADGLGSNTINGLFLAGSNLYAATTGGLSVYNSDGSSPLWTNGGAAVVNGVYIFGSYTYTAEATGLRVVNGTGVEAIYTPAQIVTGSSAVNAVNVDYYQDILAATNNGLNVLYAGTSTFQTTPLLTGMAVNGIFLDNNGNLYAATANGLYSIGSSATQILAGAVFCVYVDGAGTIYAGTNTGLETSTNHGSTWTTITWGAKVNAIVTTAPLYSF